MSQLRGQTENSIVVCRGWGGGEGGGGGLSWGYEVEGGNTKFKKKMLSLPSVQIQISWGEKIST